MAATFNYLVLLIMPHWWRQWLYDMIMYSFIKKMLVAFHVVRLLGAERKGSAACFRQRGQEQADRPAASHHHSQLLQNILAPASFLL